MASSESKTARDVLVAIADGSEEIEAVTIVDTLVRSGARVTLASVSPSLHVTCSRGVKIVADRLMVDCVGLEWDLSIRKILINQLRRHVRCNHRMEKALLSFLFFLCMSQLHQQLR